MKNNFSSYKYDLSAGILTLVTILSGNFLECGDNFHLKMLGIFILGISVIIWLIPIFTLKNNGKVEEGNNYFDTNKVVDTGIYSYLRHPQYFSYMLLNIGFTCIYQNLIVVLLCAVVVLLFYLHTIQEEKGLIMKFGGEYEKYCQKVPRFNILKSMLNS